ncbi:MAG TPA: hypothetical protein VGE26_11000 [Sphingobacteriaceae bacterium]
MARIDNQGKIRGSVGNYSYRVVGDKNLLQSKPGKVKQTANTKESASEFGLASTSAKVIRSCLYALIQGRHDGGMINRLQQTVYHAIKTGTGTRGNRTLYDGDLSKLLGFEFNNRSPLSEVLKIKPSAVMDGSGRILVTIPSFKTRRDMKMPSRANGCYLRVVVTALNFSSAYFQYTGHQQLNIQASSVHEEQTLTFDQEIPQGCVVLISMSLHFYTPQTLVGEIVLNSDELNPVSLIGIFKTDAENGSHDDVTYMPEVERYPMTAYFGNDILRDQQRARDLHPPEAAETVNEGIVFPGSGKSLL